MAADRVLPIVILALAASASHVRAQPEERGAAEEQQIADQQAAAAAKAATEQLRSRLPAEVHFAARVCSLSPEQSAELMQAAGKALDEIERRLAAASLNLTQPMPEVPSTIHEQLDLAVKRQVSEQAWSRLQAERKELRERLRHAAIEQLLAAVDEFMLLSEGQRHDVRRLLSENGGIGRWRPPAAWNALLRADRAPLQTAMTRAALGVFKLPRSDLAGILRPSQLVVKKDLLAYAYSLAENADPPIAYRRKQPLFQLSLEYVSEVCGLSDAEQTKLRLAGKLDLDGKDKRLDAPRARSAFSMPVDAVLPAGLVANDLPAYGKVWCNLLDPDEERRFETVTRERWRFHQTADLESIAAIFQRQALLTAAQCDNLFERLRQRLPDAEGQTHDRLDTFRAVAQVPQSDLEPLFDEFQWPSIVEQFALLRDTVGDNREAKEGGR